MKKSIFFIPLLFSILFFKAESQVTTFQKFYNSTPGWSSTLINSIPTLDGGYAFLSNEYDEYGIIKIDSTGNVQWSNGFTSSGPGYGRAIVQDIDSGYIIISDVIHEQ
jgi:hypothetical protein